MTDFHSQLRTAGMSAEESAARATLFERLYRKLHQLKEPSSGTRPKAEIAYFVPGRLEFFGKHTDYAGGRSILGAIERGICLVASRRTDAQIRIADIGRDSVIEFSLNANIEPAAGHWSNFPRTVARRVARDFPEARTGVDITLASDLPRASGMSSSSALVIAFFLALSRANALENTERYRQFLRTREDVASYAAAIESGGSFGPFSADAGVGTQGGSEDHIGILCSRAGFLRQYSFRPTRFEREVRFPEEWSLVVAVSGVKADKTGDARESYNRASGAARAILRMWQHAKHCAKQDEQVGEQLSLASLLANPETREELQQVLRISNDPQYAPEVLLARLQQLHEESNEIVPAAAEALASGDFERLGTLAARSQFLAETCLENQVPETIELARLARQLGAAAASAFGAGFGGSVWALIEMRCAEEFREKWMAQYHRRFPVRAEASCFFIARPGPGLIQFA
jgi:galactokinase